MRGENRNSYLWCSFLSLSIMGLHYLQTAAERRENTESLWSPLQSFWISVFYLYLSILILCSAISMKWQERIFRLRILHCRSVFLFLPFRHYHMSLMYTAGMEKYRKIHFMLHFTLHFFHSSLPVRSSVMKRLMNRSVTGKKHGICSVLEPAVS